MSVFITKIPKIIVQGFTGRRNFPCSQMIEYGTVVGGVTQEKEEQVT
jgi:succinyl-CoA synthetase alpha subunit